MLTEEVRDFHLAQIGTNVADPIDEDHINGDAEHIFQLDLRGIAGYRSLLKGFATLDHLRCWQDNHLHIIV